MKGGDKARGNNEIRAYEGQGRSTVAADRAADGSGRYTETGDSVNTGGRRCRRRW